MDLMGLLLVQPWILNTEAMNHWSFFLAPEFKPVME